MEIFTIGFAGKTAETFFGLLKQAGIKRLIDIRLNHSSQLAGFTKSDNLPYFLKEICDIAYVHEPLLAPSKADLAAYRGEDGGDWDQFAARFNALLEERHVADLLDKSLFSDRVVLLCSEATAEKCHRRLVAEYLARKWPGVTITHL